MNLKSNNNKDLIKNGKNTKKLQNNNKNDVLRINKSFKKNVNKSYIRRFEKEDENIDIYENVNRKKNRAQSSTKRNYRTKI